MFHDDPRTLRFGPGENLYGYEAIKAFRSARGGAGSSEQSDTAITTFGADFAVAATLSRRPEWGAKVGRLMQTWVRFDVGWRIVAAHVSIIEAA